MNTTQAYQFGFTQKLAELRVDLDTFCFAALSSGHPDLIKVANRFLRMPKQMFTEFESAVDPIVRNSMMEMGAQGSLNAQPWTRKPAFHTAMQNMRAQTSNFNIPVEDAINTTSRNEAYTPMSDLLQRTHKQRREGLIDGVAPDPTSTDPARLTERAAANDVYREWRDSINPPRNFTNDPELSEEMRRIARPLPAPRGPKWTRGGEAGAQPARPYGSLSPQIPNPTS